MGGGGWGVGVAKTDVGMDSVPFLPSRMGIHVAFMFLLCAHAVLFGQMTHVLLLYDMSPLCLTVCTATISSSARTSRFHITVPYHGSVSRVRIAGLHAHGDPLHYYD